MHVTATVSTPLYDSFRVQQVAGMFDVPLAAATRREFAAELPDPGDDWTIGAIVGPSASGKSSIARVAFGGSLYVPGSWPQDRAVIDAFAVDSIRTLTGLLAAVGFSSPPDWIKPYAALSTGQQFRCDLAQALLGAKTVKTAKTVETVKTTETVENGRPLVVFDEYTSAVDRVAARVGSLALARHLRRSSAGPRFVAVTCHRDVLPWLSPDWTVEMPAGRLLRDHTNKPPRLTLDVAPCGHDEWARFRPHHYLSGALSRFARTWLGTLSGVERGRPAACGFAAVVALRGFAGVRRISRLVILPEFQGIGLGRRLAAAVARRTLGEPGIHTVRITTSHPAMIASLVGSGDWRLTQIYRGQQRPQRCDERGRPVVTSVGRACMTLEWQGSRG